jgi:hypothetical protein
MLLPPLCTDGGDGRGTPKDDVEQVLERLTTLLRAWLKPNRDRQWGARLAAVALGLADYPGTELDPSVDLRGYLSALRYIEHRPSPLNTKDHLVAADVWRWPAKGRPIERAVSAGGLLTGASLAATIVALGGKNGNFQLNEVAVSENRRVAPIDHQAVIRKQMTPGDHQAVIGKKMTPGSRLGLGARLGRVAVVEGARLEIALRAKVVGRGAITAWEAFLAAVDRAARRAVPAWCEVRVGVRELNGPGTSELGPSRFRLGHGLSLTAKIMPDGVLGQRVNEW